MEKTIEFVQQLINGLSQGSIYALIALGYTMVFGVLRFINFAHGDIYMLGAFSGFYIGPKVVQALGNKPGLANVVVVIIVAMLVCAMIGMIIERLCYRPLRNRPKITVLITAIGVSLLIESLGQLLLGADPKAFPELMTDNAIELPESWGDWATLTIMPSQILVPVVTAVLLIFLTLLILKTRIGMAMRALAFNPTASALMGVNVNLVISFTFGLGSALAGAAGILISIQQPSIDPLMGIMPGLKAFVAAVLGGIGNLAGAVLGALMLGVIETMVVGYVSPTYKEAVAFAILIVILLVRPNGLLGKNVREKV